MSSETIKQVHIIAHSGVFSAFKKERIKIHQDIVIKSVLQAWNTAKSSWNNNFSVDAVECAINVMEDSGIVNAGLGSVRQADGYQRMDASIMRGIDLEFGSVLSLRGYKNPISLARYIMEKVERNKIYAHDFAKLLADQIGLEKLPNNNNHGNKSLKANKNQEDVHDTVGCVSCGPEDLLCAGTSTGGLKGANPGRIGDSPIIGAGTYCNNICGVSLTGIGENVVKLTLGKRVVDLVHMHNKSPQESVDYALNEYKNHFPNEKDSVGIISINSKGEFGIGIKGASMGWAAIGYNKKNQNFLIYGSLPNERYIEEI